MIDDTSTPSRPRRARWPIVAALTAVAAGAMALTIAVAGIPGSPAAAPLPAASAAPAAPADVPSTAQGGDIVGAGWAAPASQGGASAPGNGRGFGWGFGPGRKLGGITITKIDGAKLSLVTVDGWTRTIDSTGATITRDGATIKVGDLAVGDEIVLRQKREADGTFTVTSIRVVLPKVAGLITDVASSSLTLAAKDGAKTIVKLTSSTTYRLGKDKADKSVVTAGMQAVATGTKAVDGSLTATSIAVSPSLSSGTITEVASSSLTLAAKDGAKTIVKLTSSTTYRLGKSDAQKSAAKVGMQAVASGTKAVDGSLTATSVTLKAARIAGNVTATSATSITVTDKKGTRTTVKVTSATTYRVAGVEASKLADVKVGMWIVAEGVRNGDGSFAASAVQAAAAGKHWGWGDWKPNRGGPGKASPAPAGTQQPSSNG
jgi:hypothetical protein